MPHSPAESEAESPLSAGQIWHRLLAAQLSHAKVHSRFRGTLQLEIANGKTPSFFYWTLGDEGVVAGSGIADQTRAWIMTEEKHLDAMLRGKPVPKGALALLGDVKFARGVLDRAASQSKSTEWS